MKDSLFIKHVRMTFDEWNKSILNKTVYLSDDESQRYSLICINKVREKQIWNFNGEKVIVADDGFYWLVVALKDENFVITMFMNQYSKPILWYIDMIDGQGIDLDGVYFYNDIFLDLIISTRGEIVEEDLDELVEAFKLGILTESQFNLAKSTAQELREKISKDNNWIYDYCFEVLDKVHKQIMENKCAVYE